MNIFTPNSKSLPQQVDANTKSIENLTKMCPRIYHARTEIDISATTTLLSYTDVDTNAMDNAILIAQNGTIFKINGKGVDDSSNVILYIEFICTMLENKGDKGDTGETGATGLPALECSRVYNSPSQPLLNEIITIPLTALNRTPVSGDSLIVLYNYYENTENNTIASYLVNATFSSLTSQEASFEIINVVSNTGKAGDGFAFKGVWVSDTVYNKNDVVTYTSDNITKSYVALIDNLSSNIIPPNNSNWELFTSGVEKPVWKHVIFNNNEEFFNYLKNNSNSQVSLRATVPGGNISDIPCKYIYVDNSNNVMCNPNTTYSIGASNGHQLYLDVTSYLKEVFLSNNEFKITLSFNTSLEGHLWWHTVDSYGRVIFGNNITLTSEQLDSLVNLSWYFQKI